MVEAAAAATLTIAGFPSTDTAGTGGTVVVTAYDAYGNVATGYMGAVSLFSSDPRADLPPRYTFVAADAGRHRFAVALDTAGTQTITATDTESSGLTATESGVMVQPAAAEIFSVIGFPASDTAGATGNVTVSACDAYGNVATGYIGTVSLTSSDPLAVLPSSYTFSAVDAGQHRFAVTLETAGTQSITATDTAADGVTGSDSSIAVKPAAAATLKVAGYPSSDTAGATGEVTVTAFDTYGNVATGYAGTVALSSSDPRRHAVEFHI